MRDIPASLPLCYKAIIKVKELAIDDFTKVA